VSVIYSMFCVKQAHRNYPPGHFWADPASFSAFVESFEADVALRLLGEGLIATFVS